MSITPANGRAPYAAETVSPNSRIQSLVATLQKPPPGSNSPSGQDTSKHAFSDIATLAASPNPASEPVLATVELSVKRLVQAAFDSISSHRINEFDQVRIKSFFHRQGVWVRPIQIMLQQKSYAGYQQVWSTVLRHQFTTTQLTSLNDVEKWAPRSIQAGQTDSSLGTISRTDYGSTNDEPTGPPASRQAHEQLDRACLSLLPRYKSLLLDSRI
ncbi:hypothetical protein N7486_010851 [Penicillium sp. IBT 16267x]|nr:hypothetical protein N7486_010851 [Penicillium sp. IBT 16267x]